MEESLESVEPALNKLIKSLDNNQNAITAIKQAQTDWEKFKISSCGYIYEINGNDAQAECIVDFNKARVKILNGYVKAAKANN